MDVRGKGPYLLQRPTPLLLVRRCIDVGKYIVRILESLERGLRMQRVRSDFTGLLD